MYGNIRALSLIHHAFETFFVRSQMTSICPAMITNSIGFELPTSDYHRTKSKAMDYENKNAKTSMIKPYFNFQILHEVAGKLLSQFRRQLKFVFN